MASTLCQKLLTIFVKRHKILYGSDHTILFNFHQHVVQIHNERDRETLLTLDFQCQHQQWYHKMPDRKTIFSSKFAIKTQMGYFFTKNP